MAKYAFPQAALAQAQINAQRRQERLGHIQNMTQGFQSFGNALAAMKERKRLEQERAEKKKEEELVKNQTASLIRLADPKTGEVKQKVIEDGPSATGGTQWHPQALMNLQKYSEPKLKHKVKMEELDQEYELFEKQTKFLEQQAKRQKAMAAIKEARETHRVAQAAGKDYQEPSTGRGEFKQPGVLADRGGGKFGMDMFERKEQGPSTMEGLNRVLDEEDRQRRETARANALEETKKRNKAYIDAQTKSAETAAGKIENERMKSAAKILLDELKSIKDLSGGGPLMTPQQAQRVQQITSQLQGIQAGLLGEADLLGGGRNTRADAIRELARTLE